MPRSRPTCTSTDRVSIEAVVAPDALEQPVARQHAVPVLDEIPQQLELAAGEPDGSPSTAIDDRVEIGDEMLAAIDRRPARRRRGAPRRSTARTRAASSRRLNGLVT